MKIVPAVEKTTRTYVQEFDALRGIAAILVILHHVEIFHRWRVGPDIFFLLSGYLTTRSLQRRSDASPIETLLGFYRRRVARLAPPLLAMLAVIGPVTLLMPRTDGDFARNMVAALTYSMNWQQALTPWESRSLAHLWSLAAEQQFYLLWPPLFLLCPPRWTRPLLALLACGSVLWRFWLCGHGGDFNRIFFGLDTHADALVVGCLLALTPVMPRFEPAVRVAGLVSLAALVAAAAILPAPTAAALVLSMTLTTPLAAAVVISVDMAGPMNRLLAWRPLQAVGRMSYSLYLWNFPIIAFFHPHWRHGEKAAQLTLVALVSSAAYRWVEKPIIRHLQIRRMRRVQARPVGRPPRGAPAVWNPATRLS